MKKDNENNLRYKEDEAMAAPDETRGSGEGKDKKPSLKSEILSWIQVIVAAFVLAFLLNTFVIANSTVPTGSMKDTIMEHDRVIGSRLSYTFGDPERGDIAIFEFGWICNRCNVAMGEGEAPETCPYCGQEITRPKTLYYVKRVIGLPGDKIEIRKADESEYVTAAEVTEVPPGSLDNVDPSAKLVTAAVYVNGERLEEDYIKEPMLYMGDQTFEVPEGCYFMLGDNRNNSEDARFWNDPYISKDKMIAKVLFRYWPGIKWLDD